MKNMNDMIGYVMDEYRKLRKEGKFDPDHWDSDRFTLPLIRPWPSEYSISVDSYVDCLGVENHFEVTFHNANGDEITGFSSADGDIYEDDLDNALFRAFEYLCWMQWPDLAVEEAWKAFQKIPVNGEDRITEFFLRFQKGEKKDLILTWFNRTYSLGLPALRAKVEDNAPLHHYRIPVVWQMMAYVDIHAASLVDACEYLRSPQFGLPEGNYLEDSFEIDESNIEEINK